MKSLIVFTCAVLHFAFASQLPDYLQELICHKSDPKYEKCLTANIEKARPFFLKGIPELNLPPFDPLELPLMTVDRTLNDLVSIKAVLRNVRIVGMADTIIEQIKADPINMVGEVRLTMPWLGMGTDYDVNGQLLIVPLRSKGRFVGNFTNTQMYAKASFKTVDKDGESYFRTDKFTVKITVGDGHIKMISENPDLQFGADLISNFYNQNPRRVMDAVNPIFIETATEFYRVILDQVLSSIPAKQFLPE